MGGRQVGFQSYDDFFDGATEADERDVGFFDRASGVDVSVDPVPLGEFADDVGYSFGAPVELVISGVPGNSLVADLVRAATTDERTPLSRHFVVETAGGSGRFTLKYDGPEITRDELRGLVKGVLPEAVIN